MCRISKSLPHIYWVMLKRFYKNKNNVRKNQ